MKITKDHKFLGFIFVFICSATITFASTRGVTNQEIRIGMHTDLSGPVAIWGVPSANAIRMYFEEVNARGGVRGRVLKLIVEDHQYQVPRAIQVANKLINRDQVFAMIGSLGTPMNNAVMKKQLANNIPNLFPYTAARSMVEPLHPLKFSALSTYYSQIRAGVKHFVEEKGKKRICIMYQDTDFGHEVLDGVTDQLKAMGMSMTEKTSHKPTDSSFTTAIVKLRKANCDLITLGSIVRDTIIPIATARKMQWNVDFLGSVASYNQIVIDKSGGATEGYYAISSYEAVYPDTATGEAKTFFTNYEAKYGTVPPEAAQLGYVFAQLLVHALEKVGKKLTVESLVKTLESIEGYPNIFGGSDISFSPTKHEGVSNSLLAQVQKGRWVTVNPSVSY